MKNFPLSNAVLMIVLTYLAVVWALVVLADFLELIQIGRNVVLFYYIFNEGYPTEWLQWACLAGCVIVSGFLWGRLSAGADMQKSVAAAFGFWSFGFALMLMEDAGNIRHGLAGFIGVTFFPDDQGRSQLFYRGMAELTIYAALGFLLLWPLVRYWKRLPFLQARIAVPAVGVSVLCNCRRSIGDTSLRQLVYRGRSGHSKADRDGHQPFVDHIRSQHHGAPWARAQTDPRFLHHGLHAGGEPGACGGLFSSGRIAVHCRSAPPTGRNALRPAQ